MTPDPLNRLVAQLAKLPGIGEKTAQRLAFHILRAPGEYASELGVEMGLYDDPYDLYGRLGMDMFLANRLVVDTGMNHLGWPREKAFGWLT